MTENLFGKNERQMSLDDAWELGQIQNKNYFEKLNYVMNRAPTKEGFARANRSSFF